MLLLLDGPSMTSAWDTVTVTVALPAIVMPSSDTKLLDTRASSSSATKVTTRSSSEDLSENTISPFPKLLDDVRIALFLCSFSSVRSLATAASRACCVAVGSSRHDEREPELRTNVPDSLCALWLGMSAVGVCGRVWG